MTRCLPSTLIRFSFSDIIIIVVVIFVSFGISFVFVYAAQSKGENERNIPLIVIFFLYLVYDSVSSIPCEPLKNEFRGGRIIGGTNAIRGSIPYIASLTRRGGHFCG